MDRKSVCWEILEVLNTRLEYLEDCLEGKGNTPRNKAEIEFLKTIIISARTFYGQ
jgi:hypothetical protein